MPRREGTVEVYVHRSQQEMRHVHHSQQRMVEGKTMRTTLRYLGLWRVDTSPEP